MMKTTKNKIVVLLVFLLAHLSIYAQYSGGNADGSTSEQLTFTSCPLPLHFYAYMGGIGDGSGTDISATTTCGIPSQFYAYLGGIGDGFGSEQIDQLSCGFPSQYYAYLGGVSDGAASETVNATVCGFPPQFYAYLGGNGNGYHTEMTTPVCPTQPPVASFTASATTICVGQSVTFTDTSTNIPGAWIWTLPGGTPNTSTAQNPTVVYNTAGTYNVTLQAFNYNGNNTVTQTGYINVIAVPTVTSTTPGSRCDTGTVTLQATASAGTLNWYDAPTGGNLLGTGTSFVTPSISATTTYYVQTAVGSCTSARTAVIATVNTTPVLGSTTPASRCGAGNITLTAAAATGTIRWFDFPSGGTLLATGGTLTLTNLAASTTYYVEVTSGPCTSPRTAVTATINPMPMVSSVTAASRCDTGTVTLLAAVSGGTLNWYDAPTDGSLVGTGTSYTTPSISVSTTYYVEATNGTCTSTRTAVTATVNPTPSITATTAGSRCDTGTVTLLAAATSGTLNWYGLPSGGSLLGAGTTFITPTISATTTYYVEAINGSCNSARTAVVATVNSSPTITATVPASICSGDSFTISATASAGTLSWYNLPTGGTLLATGSNYSLGSLGVTTTYYVQATNGSCSSARTAVEVTVTNRPVNTSATPATRCGNGTLVLAATFSSGTVNWYDAPVLGNLVGTGSTFVTPVLSATTTYYAEATNGSCTTFTRTAVVATVTQMPAITSTTPASRCGAGNITLQATAASGTIRWYDLPSGGTLLATGGTLNLIGLAATTTYYVEVTEGSCTSLRTAVTATINPVPSVTATTPASRCDSGTLTLLATVSSGGTLNWYDAPTLGNLVGTGSSFTTPSIGVSTTYYVEATAGGCSSPRTAVTATVNATPSIIATTPGSRCDAGIVSLQAAANAGTLNWYSLPSGGSIIGTGPTFSTASIAATTTYYVEAVNGSCTSTRVAVIATVTASPAITATVPASICSGDAFTISATASNGTLSWYDQPSGGNLLGTGSNYSLSGLGATTTFYVQATNGSCSSARTAVEVTVTVRPSITSSTPASRCGIGTLVLAATFTSGTVNWYDAPLLGNLVHTGSTFVTPSLSATTTYYVEATNGSCTSLTRTAVTATVNEQPVVTSTTPASRCGTGSVTLQATASIGIINWYNAPTGGTLMATGGSFITPSLSVTTSYYVEVVNGSCATAARTMVMATINTAAAITSTTPGGRCDAGTVTLTATSSGGTINWYDAPTLGNLVGTGGTFVTPSLSATTTYYVEATTSCTGTRTAVTATVNEQPVLLSSTPASRCGDGVVTLQATATVGTIYWWNAPTGGLLVGTGSSFTTPVLSVTTQYYVEVVNGNCTTTRTQVTATVNPSAVITSTTPGSRCGTGTVTLAATSSGGTINWYDAPTLGNLVGTGAVFITPSLSVTTVYYVEATTACTGGRTAVTATVNTQPVLLSSTPATRCGVGTVTLTAAASSGTINWWSAPTGGTLMATGTSFTTPVLSATTDYYVEVVNASCATARTQVTATVNTGAAITSTTPGSRCGTGSVTLSATANGGTINWYDAPTLGNLVGTGSSFTTPSLSATTLYYVEATDTCTGGRTAVAATINTQPVLLSTTPGSRCGTGAVTLQATASSGTINWWSAATGGTLLASGVSFTTPVLSATTDYYVEVVNGSCSTTRTQVTATIFTVATVTSTNPASRCDAGVLTLTATANIGTLNWYNLPAGGTLLGSGGSFTTPVLSVSTTYYVEAVNGSCTSARIAVTASITPTAAPIGAANQTFCGGETVGLIAVTGTNVVWYDAPTAGNIVPPGTPIVAGTTYYASQTIGSCESATRLAVTMAAGGCLGNGEFEMQSIRLYPNPVTDILHIAATEAMTKIEVVNMLGQMVYSNKLNTLETTVDMERYAAGTYIILVSVGDQFETFKVIKK